MCFPTSPLLSTQDAAAAYGFLRVNEPHEPAAVDQVVFTHDTEQGLFQ